MTCIYVILSRYFSTLFRQIDRKHLKKNPFLQTQTYQTPTECFSINLCNIFVFLFLQVSQISAVSDYILMTIPYTSSGV